MSLVALRGDQSFDFHSSPSLAIILAAMHGLALIALLLAGLPFWLSLLLALLVLVSLFDGYMLHVFRRGANSCIGLIWLTGTLVLQTPGGIRRSCSLLSGSLITPYLLVLRVLPDGSRKVMIVLILSDGIEHEAFRRLRVWTRWRTQELAKLAGTSIVGVASGNESG